MAREKYYSPDFRNKTRGSSRSRLTSRNVSLPSITCHEGGKYMNLEGGSKRSHTSVSSIGPLIKTKSVDSPKGN